MTHRVLPAEKPTETCRVSEPSTYEYVTKNRIQPSDRPLHGWYRFVLGYPPHLVREYLKKLGADPSRDWVFDPFCGTATTPVEARLQGYATCSLDANPISILATRVKLSWDIDLHRARERLDDVVEAAAASLRGTGLPPLLTYQLSFMSTQVLKERPLQAKPSTDGFDPEKLLPAGASSLVPQGFISPKPLTRVLATRDAIEKVVAEQDVRDFMTLALANTIVTTAGNVGFGPEVYRLPPRDDADVLGAFAQTVMRMIEDLAAVRATHPNPAPAYVSQGDARTLAALDPHLQIGIVITSPPYPNEKDYTRSTRLESVLLGMIRSKRDLQDVKSRLLRSNTRNVFASDTDDEVIRDIRSVTAVANEIELRRVGLGKTSGFERLYHRVTRLYFGGMYRHLVALSARLAPGARCAYVVGDQMSYFRVPIRTAHLLADVATKAGYQVEGIELWRTRRSTTTGADLEENVLILRYPEVKGGKHA